VIDRLYDRFLEEAMREVDALTPSVPPMAPSYAKEVCVPELPPYVVSRDDVARTFVMEFPIDGARVVPQERCEREYPAMYDAWKRRVTAARRTK
jgi:hypothetical protein